MAERLVQANGVELCAETFGEPSDPPILLIMGQQASMLWWPEEFCRRLASAGRFVIRYDHRDTGRSVSYEPGAPSYRSEDLTDDAVRILDAHDVDRAHLVGMSAGGGIAQEIALEHPGRVSSVTLISTTSIGDSDRDLPGPTAEYMEHAEAFAGLDWSDTEAVIDLLVRDARVVAGSRHSFDETAARDRVTRDLARMAEPASLQNHSLLGGDDETPHGQIEAPVLVIHGTADPLFPYEHGVALAEAIPGASLVTIEGGGHELPEADWDQIVDAIVAHTAATSGL